MKLRDHFLLIVLLLLTNCSNVGTKRFPASNESKNCFKSTNKLLGIDLSDKVISSHVLRLETKDGKGFVESPAGNFLLGKDGAAYSYLGRFSEKFINSGVEKNNAVFQEITTKHAEYEMNFMIKNPSTGAYDKVFEVPFRGYVPVPYNQFEKITSSTEPFMVAFRDTLQKVYSSNGEIDVNALDLSYLSKDSQEIFKRVIEESIYFEPKLVSSKMRDYPFSPVVGFDFAIDDVNNIRPIAYEANGSTPSGLSNNIQLKSIFADADGELFETIRNKIVTNNPFMALKKTIDSNARKWTKSTEGISVVIGPGSFNAAHPDVAAIAEFSGMPLVKVEDLYIDNEGWVRLNVNKGTRNPKVTGVYSRVDESFLIQSNKLQIPIRDPHFYVETNKMLSKKYGINLEPHIGYAYTYDENWNVVGLEFNKDGSPKLLETFYKLGKDPTRLESTNSSDLAKALMDGKIYISNIGGRTLDDKRIFQMISDEIAPKFNPNKSEIVGPPKSLRVSDFEEFYNTPLTDMGKYVVKVPDESGGQGVYILVNEPMDVRQRVLDMVKSNPQYYTIQEFANQSLVNTVGKDNSGNLAFETTAMDARYYSMLDGEGKLVVDPDAFLARVAKPKSGSTNTSQGAGYGQFLVVKEGQKRAKKNILPQVKDQRFIGVSRQQDLREYAKNLNFLMNLSASEKNNIDTYIVENLINTHRDLIDIIGRPLSPYIKKFRAFKDGNMSRSEFNSLLNELRAKLMTGVTRSSQANDILRKTLVETQKYGKFANEFWPLRKLKKFFRFNLINNDKNSIEFFNNGKRFTQREIWEITDCEDTYVSNILKNVQKNEGRVHHIRVTDESGQSGSIGRNYLRFDSDNYPIIGVDFSQFYSASALAHEYQHFVDWLKIKNTLVKNGMSESQARKKAKEATFRTLERIAGERRAVRAELESELYAKSAFNRSKGRFAVKLTDSKFIHNQLYPEVEGLKDLLVKSKGSINEQSITLMRQIYLKSSRYRLAAIRDLESEYKLAKLESSKNEILGKILYFKNTSALEMAINNQTQEQFINLGMFNSLRKLYSEIGQIDLVSQKYISQSIQQQQQQQ